MASTVPTSEPLRICGCSGQLRTASGITQFLCSKPEGHSGEHGTILYAYGDHGANATVRWGNSLEVSTPLGDSESIHRRCQGRFTGELRNVIAMQSHERNGVIMFQCEANPGHDGLCCRTHRLDDYPGIGPLAIEWQKE